MIAAQRIERWKGPVGTREGSPLVDISETDNLREWERRAWGAEFEFQKFMGGDTFADDMSGIRDLVNKLY